MAQWGEGRPERDPFARFCYCRRSRAPLPSISGISNLTTIADLPSVQRSFTSSLFLLQSGRNQKAESTLAATSSLQPASRDARGASRKHPRQWRRQDVVKRKGGGREGIGAQDNWEGSPHPPVLSLKSHAGQFTDGRRETLSPAACLGKGDLTSGQSV